MNACERFINNYKLSRKQLPGHALPWLTAIRDNAITSFSAQGLPDAKNESWKYTPLTQIERSDYRLAQPLPQGAVDGLREALKRSFSSAYCLVFINGYYRADLSTCGALPKGVILSSISEALHKHPQLLASELGKVANLQTHPFTALNTALLCDGVFLWAAENSTIEQPIHCLFISSADEQPLLSSPRLLLVMKENAQLTLLEHYIDISELKGATAANKHSQTNYNLLNTVSEISLASGAGLNHYKLQYESTNSAHIAAMYVQQQGTSRFTSHSYSLGAALARNDIQVKLSDRQGECCLNGMYLVDGSQHVDYHTQIAHLAPACNSQQLYKGVIQGRARAVFNGEVIIDPVAQQSAARQLNKNLLLSEQGEVDSKPELQIYADDVICSHGATVGQLDKQALFYLQSRGLSEQDAQAWLVYGFISELLERIDNPALRRFIEAPLIAHLQQLIAAESNLQDLLPTENGQQPCP